MSIFPTLRYDDAPAALAFLRDTFGFEVLADYRSADDPQRVDHAELRWPEGGGVMLGSAKRSVGEVTATHVGAASVYVVTDRPDEIHAQCMARGAVEIRGLRDEDYGSRGFTVADPEGNRWSFGTYRGA